MMAELTEKFCNILDDSARKKHKKRSGRVGLAELVLAELSGNRKKLNIMTKNFQFKNFLFLLLGLNLGHIACASNLLTTFP
jgi:hypothetical protein